MSFFNPRWHLSKGRNVANWKTLESPTNDTVFDEEQTKIADSVQLSSNVFLGSNSIGKTETENRENPRQTTKILWVNVTFIVLFHVIAVYAMLFETWRTKWQSFIWGFVVGGIGGFGITAGVHRLWAHRAYKAKLPLKIILLMCYSVAGQNDVREWVRDHRVHHRFSETDADPHNSNRGLFFAHVGWLMQPKHPEVSRLGKTVNMSDIYDDPLISFHTKYFLLFKLIFCFIIPVLIPVYCWHESWWIAIASQVFVRYILNLNFTWSVNSLAHAFGDKPYDKTIKPTQNLAVCVMAMGEGFHNYHHVFPWDYKAAELGNYNFNITTFWLDLFAKIGWAYDLRTPSPELIQKVIQSRREKSFYNCDS